MSRPQDTLIPPHDLPAYLARRTSVQHAATAVAVIFLALGVLGFLPGVTAGALRPGEGSAALLFGLFAVSVLQNVLHLGFGLVGLVFSATATTARRFLIGGGLVSFGVFLYGVMAQPSVSANFLGSDTADNWLHAGLAALMIVLGVAFGRRVRGR